MIGKSSVDGKSSDLRENPDVQSDNDQFHPSKGSIKCASSQLHWFNMPTRFPAEIIELFNCQFASQQNQESLPTISNSDMHSQQSHEEAKTIETSKELSNKKPPQR